MAVGTRGNRENLQDRVDSFTKDHVDIAKTEGRITDGMSLTEMQSVLVTMAKEAETTSSDKTVLLSIPDNRAGTQTVLNGRSASSGSDVGLGQFIGTFSGSADFAGSGSSNISLIGHFNDFSGSMSASALEVGCLGTPSYGRVLIGKPSTYIAGAPPEGLVYMPFSGSFKIASGKTLNTPESSSALQASASGTGSISNSNIPGGSFTAKWISGSFNPHRFYRYNSHPASMSADLSAGLFFTSSNFTNADLNNISESSFVGSVAVLTGSLSGMWDTGQGYQYPASNQLISKHGKAVSADMDFVFNSNMMIGGQFFQSGSITRNPNSGAIINAILAGGVFAIAPSGSLQIVSGSVESLEGQSFILKAPGSAFDSSGTARGSFHDKKRVTNVKGARDEFQLKKLREEKTSNFVSTGRKMTTNPLK